MKEDVSPAPEKEQPVERKTEVAKEDVPEKVVEKKAEPEPVAEKKAELPEKQQVEEPKEAKKEPKGKLFLKTPKLVLKK